MMRHWLCIKCTIIIQCCKILDFIHSNRCNIRQFRLTLLLDVLCHGGVIRELTDVLDMVNHALFGGFTRHLDVFLVFLLY